MNVHEAKTHLSRLLAEVADGQEVVIANRGVPVARLVAMGTAERPSWGSVRLDGPGDADAFAPMTADEAAELGLA